MNDAVRIPQRCGNGLHENLLRWSTGMQTKVDFETCTLVDDACCKPHGVLQTKPTKAPPAQPVADQFLALRVEQARNNAGANSS